MLSGKCSCGSIQYQVHGELGPIVHCHCQQCRKASGTAFSTNASIRRKDFEIVSGESLLKSWESSPGVFRHFCSQCGSPIIKSLMADPDSVRLRIGTLDDEPPENPVGHIFVKDKASWTTLDEILPRYDTREPQRK